MIATPQDLIETRELKRGIGERQLSMIAIGGAIGTALFFAKQRRRAGGTGGRIARLSRLR